MVCVLEQDTLVRYVGVNRTPLIHISEMPSALNGAATHNIANALAATAAATHLGVSDAHIIQALRSFGANRTDNPGRCQQFALDSFHLIVDFAHNPAGVRAVLSLAKAMMQQGAMTDCVSPSGKPETEQTRLWMRWLKKYWPQNPLCHPS